jgi:type I restriction enzyme S subunit
MAEIKKACTLLEQMRQDANRLMDAALKQAFDKSTSHLKPEPLAKHVIHLTSGPRHWGKYASSRNSGPLFIRVGNVGFGRLELADVERLELPSSAGEERARIKPGDVLVTITGTIGRCCVASDNLERSYVNQHVALIRLKSSLESRYLMWFILSPSGGYAQATTMQYGQTRPGLNLTNVRNLRLPVPTRSVQQEVVTYLDSIQAEAHEMQRLLEQNAKLLDQLEQSILERAFRGEL